MIRKLFLLAAVVIAAALPSPAYAGEEVNDGLAPNRAVPSAQKPPSAQPAQAEVAAGGDRDLRSEKTRTELDSQTAICMGKVPTRSAPDWKDVRPDGGENTQDVVPIPAWCENYYNQGYPIPRVCLGNQLCVGNQHPHWP